MNILERYAQQVSDMHDAQEKSLLANENLVKEQEALYRD